MGDLQLLVLSRLKKLSRLKGVVCKKKKAHK